MGVWYADPLSCSTGSTVEAHFFRNCQIRSLSRSYASYRA